MKTKVDNIELVLPFKAEYVSVARLTVSGVANRVGFDIDTIEDIKVALAEVCNKLINAGSTADYYRITFRVSALSLTIEFDSEDKALNCIFSEEEDGLGISIINALMDNVELCTDEKYLLSMSKTLEGNI